MGAWCDPVGWWGGIERPFRHLPRGWAIAFLLVLAGALAWSAWAVPQIAYSPAQRAAVAHAHKVIGDLELYRRIDMRVAAGENYYTAAETEQEAHDYPTKPFITVRLPTLAYLNAWMGVHGTYILAIALLMVNLLVWFWQLSFRGLNLIERVAGTLFVLAGGVLAFEPRAGLMHELIAGQLLALSLGIMRRGLWPASLLLAALALSIRELALPFVLLWLVFAISQRHWRQAIAVTGVIVLFVLGMWLHAHEVAIHEPPGGRMSPPWDGIMGPRFALYSLARLSVLMILPPWMAGPLALLPFVGWLGWGGRFSLFAFLWFGGYFLALCLFARLNNFYWAQIMLPAYAAGMALVPRSLWDLLQAAKGTPQIQS